MDSRLVAALVAAATITAGCSKEKVAVNSDSAAATATTAPAATTPNLVTVHAKDFSFDGPKQIPAGMTTFRLVNDGPNLHHMDIVRLDDGKTVADLEQALQHPGPPPSWAAFMGGPNAPDPGSDATATMNMAPGNYAVVCMVDVPGGVPHFAKGMVTSFTVVPSTVASAPAPVSDDTLTLTDYKFGLSTPITAGKHTFMVRNSAGQEHEVELVKLAPGKTAQDVLKWINKPDGPPPGHALGGVAGFQPGGEPLYFTADFTPGDYAFICFVPDARDGKPHFMHGMMESFTVS
jgi:hypothetical protein